LKEEIKRGRKEGWTTEKRERKEARRDKRNK
jgi:hypothetical protein